MEPAPAAKVTYVSLSADDPATNAAFDAGIAAARGKLGRTTPLYIDGRARHTAATTDSRKSPDALQRREDRRRQPARLRHRGRPAGGDDPLRARDA